MSSKKSKFIKQFFFILILFFNKNFAQRCVDVTSNVNQKLAIQALASQSYLNNLVIRFDESKKKYVDTVYEMKSLTDAIEVGLVDLSKDVQQAIKTERSLIRTASGILEYQYSLNEQAASVVDFLLSAPVKQKQILLDLDFLDDKAKEEMRDTINKYSIDFKEGFNFVPEYYTDEIDELLGYVPGDPYATKATLIASEIWGAWAAFSTSWHPGGDYVAITGWYFKYPPDSSNPNFHLGIYKFDGTSLGPRIDPLPTPEATQGMYRSIDWSSGGGYLVVGGRYSSPDHNSIRIFTFSEGPPTTVEQLAGAKYDPSLTYEARSVAWHPKYPSLLNSDGFFAVVGDGDGVDVKEIQVYKIDLGSVSPTLIRVYEESWGSGESKVYSCSWSKSGEYLAVAGKRNDVGQVLRVFAFDSDSGSLSEVTSMNYNQFDFDIDWVSGVDWAPNDQHLALSSNTLLTPHFGESPQIAMDAAGNAFAVWKHKDTPSSKSVIQAIRYDVLAGFWQEEAVTLSSSVYESLEPQVAINNDGDAIAVWKRDNGDGSCTIQANRYDASTGSWQSPSAVTNLSLSGQDASLPQVVMYDDGSAIAVWQRPTGNPGEIVIQSNRYNGNSWQDPSDVTNLSDINEKSEKLQIAMNDAGDAIVVWRNFDGGGSYSIQARKYDHKSCDWLSVVNIFSDPLHSVDNPQVAMSNEIAIIVWEGKETSPDFYLLQTRVNISLKGWEHQDAWEPSLNKEPEVLFLNNSKNPQIAVRDYEGIAAWEFLSGSSLNILATKYILGQGWQQSIKDVSYGSTGPQGDTQVAMDGAGNAIVVWRDFSGLEANRYNAITDSWQGPAKVGMPLHIPVTSGSSQIAMDQDGNAIVMWQTPPHPWIPPYSKQIIYASRYSEMTLWEDSYIWARLWEVNLGEDVARYSLKVVRFDDSSPPEDRLTFCMAWNEVEEMFVWRDHDVKTAKWAPSGKAVAIATGTVRVNGIPYGLLVFEVDFSSETLTLREGGTNLHGKWIAFTVYSDLAWRPPDGRYISATVPFGEIISPDPGPYGFLDIYDLDYDYFGAVIDTYDASLPTKQEMKWPNKGESDIGILSNIARKLQGKNGTKSMPTKFAIPDGYLTAANFVDVINPACISADYGLTAVLDASIEVTDSLLGARKRNYKFMQDNLKLSKRLTDVYKKSIEIKKTEQARVIDQPGVYTFNKDVQGVIVIDADNITLDLNGYKIFSDSKVPITVNKNIKNISIKNGSIVGGNQYLGAPSGVLVKEGAQHITLENLTITFCYEGVTFKGEQDCSVTDCLVQDCAFKSNIKAASLDCSEYVTFKECEFLDCFLESVNLENNNKNCYQ